MTRKRALILSGSFAVSLAGYVAWCTRSMYLGVEPPEMLELPAELRKDAKAIIVERGLTRPDRFDLKVVKNLLAKPYNSAPVEMLVSPLRNPEGWHVGRPRRSHWKDEYGADFVLNAGVWQVTPDLDEVNPRPLKAETP